MNIKLVVADVDGTLLNSRHELTEFTGETLLALQQRGIKYTLATGRVLSSVSNIVDTLGLDQPLILASGALIQQADRTVLFETTLPPQHFPALLDCVKTSCLDYALFMRDQVFVPRHTHNTALIVEYNDPQPIEIGQMDLADKTFCKLIVLAACSMKHFAAFSRLTVLRPVCSRSLMRRPPKQRPFKE
jgi:HAD superfamily hydrolase (TIGR01484 family)